MRHIKSWWSAVGVLVVLSLVTVGCAPTQPASSEPADSGTPAAAEQEVIKWTGQSCISDVAPMHAALQNLCVTINDATDGRIEMKVESAGAICTALKEFDAIDQGTLDFAGSSTSFNMDKFPWGSMVVQRVGGMSAIENYCWKLVEGDELCSDLMSDYNVVMPHGSGFVGPPEVFFHSSVKIESLADLKGLKARCSGDCGAVLDRLGASTVMIPPGEIFESMQRGIVDCFEMSCATFNLAMGLHEANAPYVYIGPSRAPHETWHFFVNKDKWNALPDDLKQIVTDVCISENIQYYADLCAQEAASFQVMRDYGLTVEKINPEIEAAIIVEAEKYFAEKAARDAGTAAIRASQDAFQESFRSVFDRP
ncbi:MAG: TRAP transporter substrate-binding protein DctP [Dehalococcoidia bacterium]|nr:TRAP transporter substrate-binding protein DctP [Dehalococcoidia bacterium]